MASEPTEVVRESEVAGNGPPCTMAWQTSTPVPKPLIRIRPAFSSSTGNNLAAASVSASVIWMATVSWPSSPSSTDISSSISLAANHQRGRAEHFFAKFGMVLERARPRWRKAPLRHDAGRPPHRRRSSQPACDRRGATRLRKGRFDAGGQHGRGGDRGHGGGGGGSEGVDLGDIERQHQAGIGAELARAQSQGRNKLAARWRRHVSLSAPGSKITGLMLLISA